MVATVYNDHVVARAQFWASHHHYRHLQLLAVLSFTQTIEKKKKTCHFNIASDPVAPRLTVLSNKQPIIADTSFTVMMTG
jgi:hypothetical protein